MTSAEVAILLANGALLALISSLMENIEYFQKLASNTKQNVITAIVIIITLGVTYIYKPADTGWLLYICEVLTKTLIFWASIKGYHLSVKDRNVDDSLS